MNSYRLLRGSFGRYENGVNVIYKPGKDTILELTAEQAAGMKDVLGSRVELVDAEAFAALGVVAEEVEVDEVEAEVTPEDLSDSDSDENEVDEVEFEEVDIRELNVAEATDYIADVEDPAVLQFFQTLEESGSERKGVLKAIAAQLETLAAADD